MQRVSDTISMSGRSVQEDRREWRAGVGAATVILGSAFAVWVVLSAPIQVSELTENVVPAAEASAYFTLSSPSRDNGNAFEADGLAGNAAGGERVLVALEDISALKSGDITAIQEKLKSLGFDPGKSDGAAGPRTLAALNAYRKSLGLTVVPRIDRQAAAPLLP